MISGENQQASCAVYAWYIYVSGVSEAKHAQTNK